jgi:hypothetical protein
MIHEDIIVPGDMVKLHEARQALATPVRPYTTSPAREIVMHVQCTCRTCGAVFTLRPGEFRQRGGTYCSRPCQIAGKRTAVERPCEQCGAQMSVQPNVLRRGSGRFCSRPCLAKAQAAVADARLLTRFWSRVDKNGPVPAHRPDLGPCWLWTARLDANGYGAFSVHHRGITAHQMAWILAGRPPIPKGMDRDHLCRVRHCVRPKHLDGVTHAENVRRGAQDRRTEALRGA